jgi:hypothetical protein
VKEKGGKPDRKPHPLSYVLRNPYRNLKSDNSQDFAQNLNDFGFFMAYTTHKTYIGTPVC